MVNYKKYINLLKSNTCSNCIFFKYRSSKIFNYKRFEHYHRKGFSSCSSYVACFCETELKMTEEQMFKYIFKGMKICYRDLVTSRIIDFIKKTKLEKIAKLEIE